MITKNTSKHSKINNISSAVTAFVSFEDRIFISSSTHHPIGELIEFIWTNEPKWARLITRNRIYTRLKLSPLSQGMVKVAGKRYTILSEHDFFRLFYQECENKNQTFAETTENYWPSPIQVPRNEISIEESANLALQLSKLSSNGIGAILLDEQMHAVSWGWNDHFSNRTLHAEIMLAKNYLFLYGRPIPKNHKLITTRLPCAMCSGYLHGHAEDFSSLTIIYIEDDPGPFAQNSILFQNSSLFTSSGLSSTAKLKQY